MLRFFDRVNSATLKGFDFSIIWGILGFPTFVIFSGSYIRCFSLLKSLIELSARIFSLIKLFPVTFSLMCVNIFCIAPAFFSTQILKFFKSSVEMLIIETLALYLPCLVPPNYLLLHSQELSKWHWSFRIYLFYSECWKAICKIC